MLYSLDLSFIYSNIPINLALILWGDFVVLIMHLIPCINLGSR